MTYDNHTQNQSFRGSLQARAREKEREKAEKHCKRFCKNCKLLHNPNLEWSTCVQILKSDIEKCCNIGLSAQLRPRQPPLGCRPAVEAAGDEIVG